VLRPVSARLTKKARQEKLPIGAPLEYECAQYVHQVPGGVISNLKHQLGELGILHRLDEVFEEIVQVLEDFGYPRYFSVAIQQKRSAMTLITAHALLLALLLSQTLRN